MALVGDRYDGEHLHQQAAHSSPTGDVEDCFTHRSGTLVLAGDLICLKFQLYFSVVYQTSQLLKFKT